MYLFLMKFFQNIYDNANKWLDSKLKEVEQQEREFQVFEIQYDEIKNPKPDWANVYKNILDLFHTKGVICVEFFQKNNDIYINEIALRVHNTYHLSLDCANISQFDLHTY